MSYCDDDEPDDRWHECPMCGGDGEFALPAWPHVTTCIFCGGLGVVEDEPAEGLDDLRERCGDE